VTRSTANYHHITPLNTSPKIGANGGSTNIGTRANVGNRHRTGGQDPQNLHAGGGERRELLDDLTRGLGNHAAVNQKTNLGITQISITLRVAKFLVVKERSCSDNISTFEMGSEKIGMPLTSLTLRTPPKLESTEESISLGTLTLTHPSTGILVAET